MSVKLVLDACCGGKYCWFDTQHPQVLYVDQRRCEKGHIDLQPNHEVQPDEIVDFRKMPYPDRSFHLVLFDPPHIFESGGKEGFIHKKYGSLSRETWASDIKAGMDECFRVVKMGGVIVFKWAESRISLHEVLNAIGRRPLFGNKNLRGKTHWLCFMKLAE